MEALMSDVLEVTQQTFEAEVLASKVPVLVDFTATWCAPCRALKPILAKLAKEGEGRFKVLTLDGDENPDLAARYRVKGFPTVVAFADGRETGRHIGLTSKDRLLALLQP
jgi:thioredoxin 1